MNAQECHLLALFRFSETAQQLAILESAENIVGKPAKQVGKSIKANLSEPSIESFKSRRATNFSAIKPRIKG